MMNEETHPRTGAPLAKTSEELGLNDAGLGAAEWLSPSDEWSANGHVVVQLLVTRPSWDEYFMDVAYTTAKRSTCAKRHVGAVIVRDKRIIATGYNGAPKGLPHCPGHDIYGDPSCMENGRCARAIHAEVNAVIACAAAGVRVTGASIYSTTLPCPPCMRVIINSGIIRVVYQALHSRADQTRELADQAGIVLQQMDAPDE